MFSVIKKTKLWFSISVLIIIAGIVSLTTQGLNMGIDFKGGTIVELSVGKTIDEAEEAKIIDIVRTYDADVIYNTAVDSKVNDSTQIDLKSNSGNLSEENLAKIIEEVKKDFPEAKIANSDVIGATIGNELKQKASIAVVIAVAAMLIYIAFRFEILFGISSIVALLHDILIVITFYSIFQIQVDSPFIAAMLTVLGYSMNDTIVVFDRIRENLKNAKKSDTYADIADTSIKQTIHRSILTVTTTLITISAITIGVPEVRNFGLPLIVGITAGCYSSIFIASPTWVLLKKKFSK